MFIRIIDCNEKSFLERNGRLPRNLRHEPYAAETGVFLLSTDDISGTVSKYGSTLGGLRSLRKDDLLHIVCLDVEPLKTEKDRSGAAWPESYFMAGDILRSQISSFGHICVLGIRADDDCIMSEIIQ